MIGRQVDSMRREFDIKCIKDFNDRHLVESTGFFVKEEREILAILLHHFHEISARRIYSDYKYRSLHEMLVQYYKYSDDQAYRRRSAMRLLYELPEIEEKICSGDLNLTNMNLAQSLFRQDARFDKGAKIEIIDQLCDQAINAPVMKPRITRAVFARAGHKCEICTSTYALEVDHILPKAKGGSDKLENLRLLCRSCNQRAAIKHYGQPKMEAYLS